MKKNSSTIWGPQRGPKENRINEKPKEDTIVKPIDNSINEDSRELQDPQWLLRRKLILFGFLVIV